MPLAPTIQPMHPPNTDQEGGKRKRVSFDQDRETDNVKRRIHVVDRSEDASKIHLWVQRSEIMESFRQAQAAATNDSPLFATYTRSLSETYFGVDNTTSPSRWGIVHSDKPILMLSSPLSSHDTIQGLILGTQSDVRGLETFSLPIIGQDRARRRAQHTQGVIQLHQSFKSNRPNESNHLLARVSSSFTQSAANFAAVMGLADAISAFCDYMETLEAPPPALVPEMISYSITNINQPAIAPLQERDRGSADCAKRTPVNATACVEIESYGILFPEL